MAESVRSLIDELTRHDPDKTVLVEVVLPDGTAIDGHVDKIKREGSYVVLVCYERE